MNSSGATQSSGACGGQVAEEDDEESSSSSLTISSSIEDELESFRQKWKQDLAGSAGNLRNLGPQPKGNDNESIKNRNYGNLSSTEEKARGFFLEGVEHEQNGELFEAIQKYRKAVNLVPDIEFKVEQERRRDGDNGRVRDLDRGGNNTDEELEDIDPEDPEVNEETDLLLKFARMKLKGHSSQDVVDSGISYGMSSSSTSSSSLTQTHISSLPMEVLIYILKWVVSSELDLKSLENFSQVCRGFYVASRTSDIWRRICIQTWVAGLPIEEPSLGGWRTIFLSRPRVNFNGCYISRVTYLREGERGFQDNEFYKSWHVVHYYRILRFFPGGRAIMVTTAEEPAVAVKLLNSRYSSGIQGCMFGQFRTINNHIHVVLQKPKPVETKSNRRYSLNKKKSKKDPYVFEVPDQNYHMELEIKGKRHQQLHWLCYSVLSKYKDGREQLTDLDVTNLNNYPTMIFSQVKSYTSETFQPLN